MTLKYLEFDMIEDIKYWFFRIGNGLMFGLIAGFILFFILMFLLASCEYPGEQNPKLFTILTIFNIICSASVAIFVIVYIIIKYDSMIE